MPVSLDLTAKCQEWSYILYSSSWENTERWTDVFVDTNLESDPSNSNIILTRFGPLEIGAESLANSFWCITGYGLYDFMPWYKVMEDYLSSNFGFRSHLDFPCILISQDAIRKHKDVGRATVLNYNIFGCEHFIFGIDSNQDADAYDVDLENNQYTTSFDYLPNKSCMMDVELLHGAEIKPDIAPSQGCAMVNHGFWNKYVEVHDAFSSMAASGQLAELQGLLDDAV